MKWFSRKQPEAVESPGLLSRMKQGLNKTRQQLGAGARRLLWGQQQLDPALRDALETLLLSADLGISTSDRLLSALEQDIKNQAPTQEGGVYELLQQRLLACLTVHQQLLNVDRNEAGPFVILMVGVNGAGKTTTIGKLAKQFQAAGHKVMLAAGDTFRAAAVEQLQIWGERNQVPVIAQQTGADSASVIFDALQAAKARGMDVLIADTAGRLHTQHNLMEELKKIKRVLAKLDPSAPHETMLVLDASIGQNALNQARQFHQAIGVTGVTMTKLDGTAKGGIVFAIANELGIPLRYLGLGEGVDDLRPFDAERFVQAIFNDDPV